MGGSPLGFLQEGWEVVVAVDLADISKRHNTKQKTYNDLRIPRL
jgi:hypothetical protein